MKLSNIALLTMLIGTGQLAGCATTGAAPATSAEPPQAGSTATTPTEKPAAAPAEKPATGGGAEPECN